eukprot:7711595-Prorocentrum_lima.AAC.1
MGTTWDPAGPFKWDHLLAVNCGQNMMRVLPKESDTTRLWTSFLKMIGNNWKLSVYHVPI